MLAYEHWMQTGDVSLFAPPGAYGRLVLNTMLPFIRNDSTQLVDWRGHLSGVHESAPCHRDPAAAISDGYALGSCDEVDWPPQNSTERGPVWPTEFLW